MVWPTEGLVVADELMPVPDTFWVAAEKTGEMREPQPDERHRVRDFAWLDEPEHEPAPKVPLEMTIALKAPRAQAEALAAKLREELAALGPGATVTVVPAEETTPGSDIELLREALRNLEAYAQGVSWDKEKWALERIAKAVAQPEPPEVVAWQRHVCAAWARALGQADVTAATAPTVLDLQDATATKLSHERTVGVRMAARMWTAALGIRRPLTEGILTPEELIEHTIQLVEREQEQGHALQDVQNKLDAHRARMGQAPESASVNENPTTERLVRSYVRERAAWLATPSPGDQKHYDEMDALVDEMKEWVDANPGPSPAAPEAPDPAIVKEDAANGETPGSKETDDDIPF